MYPRKQQTREISLIFFLFLPVQSEFAGISDERLHQNLKEKEIPFLQNFKLIFELKSNVNLYIYVKHTNASQRIVQSCWQLQYHRNRYRFQKPDFM